MVSHRESFLSSVKSALIKHLHLFDFDGTICFSEGFDEEKLVDPVVNKVIVRQMSDLLEAGEEVAILSSRKNSGIIKNFIEREAGLFMDVPIYAIGDPDEAAKGEYIKRNFNDYDIVTLHDDNTSYLQNATEILKDSGIEFIPVVVKDERKVRPVKKDAAKSVKAVSEDIIAKTCTNYREATKDMSVDEVASFWDLIGTESDFYDQVDEKIRELLMSGDSFYDTWYSKLMDNEKHAVIICDISFDSVVDFLVERDTVLFLHEGEDVFSDSVFMDVLNLGMDSYYVSLEFSSHGFLFEDGSTLDINDDHRVIDINTWFPENIVTLHISQRDLNVRLNTTTTSLQFEYLDSLLYEKSIENVYYDVYQGNAMVGHGDIDLRQDFDELDWRKLVKKRNAARKNTGASDKFRYFNNEDVKKYAPETLKSNIFKMFSGDQLNDILYVLEELKEVGAEIDDNGLVTVYHYTSEENADKILKTGEMVGKEDNLFFTTKKDGQASGYGTVVLSFKIPIEYLELDDIFADEAHVTFAGVPNKGVNVKPFLPVRASANPVIPDDLVASLEAAGYLTTFYNDDYNEVPVEQATKLSVFSVTDWANDKVTIKLPKSKVLTFDIVMSKLSQGSTYKNFAETFKNILNSKRQGGGLIVYPTTYGIGIFVAVGSRGGIDEIKQEVEATLAEYGIQYTTEYSNARWVFRYRISKSAANIEKLENINKSVKASAFDPLLVEARKYETADDWLNSLPILYQGGGDYVQIESRIGGIYLTKSIDYAAKFAKGSGKIARAYAFIKNPYDLSSQVENQPERELLIEAPHNFTNEIASLRSAGYDAIVLKDQVLVLNPSIVKTSEELIDIWNKANGVDVKASFYGDVSVRLKSPNKESFKFVEDLFDKISIYNTGMSRGISLVYHDGGENPDPLIKDFFFDGDGNHFCRVKKAENKEIILELSLPAYSECLESLIAHLLSGVSFVIDCEDSGIVEYYGDKPPLTESVVTFKSVKAFEDSELISRAKQYDTFEEFLKTFGDPVYHGSGSAIYAFDYIPGSGSWFLGKGLYFNADISRSSQFGVVTEAYLDLKNPYVSGEEFNSMLKEGLLKLYGKRQRSVAERIIDKKEPLKSIEINPELITKLYKSAGYDGVISSGGVFSAGRGDIVVFNTSQIKTKAQIKDIWDKAHSMSVSSSVPFTTVFYNSMVGFLKELFDIDVEVKYGNTKKDLFGFMPLSLDSGVSSVTIDTSGSLKYVLKSIIHELTHIKQVQYGQLATDGISILWEGVPVISVNQYNSLKRSDWAVYSELPFEKEAFANSEELFNLYVSSPYFKDLANSEDTSVSYVAKTGFNVSSGKYGLGIDGLIGPVYHGTPEKFDSFDVGKAGTSTDSGMYGVGFYFSSDYDFASTYSVRGDKTGEVKEVYLDLKNPLILNNRSDIPKIAIPSETMEDLRNSDKNYSKLFTKFLRDNGYDGVIENISGKPQYMVLDASQIIQAPLKTVASSTDFNSLQMLIVDLAQEVLDSWQPDEDGIDDDFGGGGVCDEINRHIQSVLVDAGFEVYEGGQEGSDHAFTYAVKDGKAFYVDIPPYVYETGSGYSWKKLEGVRLKPSDVVINEISLDDLNDIVDSEDRIISSFSGSFIAYHGSYSDFDTFTQVTKAGVDSFATTQPLFFTRQYKYAYQNYANAKGGIVYKCLLSPKKMFMVTDDLAEDIGKIGWWDRLTEVGESLMLWLTGELSDDDKVEDIFMSVVKRDYDTMESDLIIRWIKNEGYDSFEVIEYGDVNVSVLDTSIIKILEKIDPGKVSASFFNKTVARTVSVPSEFSGQTFYHGGSYDDSVIQDIFINGLKGREEQGKYMFAPVKDSVYMTKDFRFALIYAMGGNILGTSHAMSDSQEKPFGLVFEIPGSSLTNVHPDEDAIGELIWRAYNENTSSLNWIKYYAENYLTPNQLKKIKEGEYSYYAQGGKRLIKLLPPSVLEKLMGFVSSFANEGRVAVSGAYVVDRRHPEILKGEMDSLKQYMVYISSPSEMPQAITQLEEQAKSLGVKDSITASVDTDVEYMKAAESGDLETCSRMVKEAAERAGYNVGPVFHGTDSEFHVFDTEKIGKGSGNFGHYGYGFYFSEERLEASVYGSIIIKAYLSIKNPFKGDSVDHLGKYSKEFGDYDKVDVAFDKDWLLSALKKKDSSGYALAKLILEKGYEAGWSEFVESGSYNEVLDLNRVSELVLLTDATEQVELPDWAIEQAVEFFGEKPKTVKDYPFHSVPQMHWMTNLGSSVTKELTDKIKADGHDGIIAGTEYVVFSPEQIKLADPITYDDSGNIIPLSKRFDSGSRDIRASKDFENYMKVSASGIYGLILVSPATVVDWVDGVKDLHFEEGVKWLFDKYPDKELTLEICNYLRNLYVKITGENIKSITPVWEQSICPRYVEEVGKVFLGTQDNIWDKDGNVITASELEEKRVKTVTASKASNELLSLFNSLGGVTGIAENGYEAETPLWYGKEPFEMTEEEYRAYQKYIEPVDHDTAQVMSDMLNELFEAVGSDPMGGYVLTSRLFDGCLTVTAWKYSKYVDSFLICCVGDTQEGDMLKNWGSFLAWIKFGMSEGFENKPGLKDYISPFSGDVMIVKAKKNKNWEEYSDDVTAPLSQKYGISFGKDKDGYFARTHRARSDSFESVDKIPVSQLKFIGTTGSVKASAEEDSQRREEAHQYNLQILDKIQSKEYVLDKDYNDFSITVKSEPSLKIKQSDNYSGYLNENTNTIHININSRDESESDFIRSVLYDRKVWENIFHEYIHYSDLLRMGRLNYTHPQKGVEKYYNQPVEYNAYYQQAMMYVDKMLNNMSAGERADVLSSFDKFYNLLNMDEGFQKNMSDETQKKLLKRVYKSFSSVQSGKKVKASESWAIPPQLEGFYNLTGDASNAPNWKAQVLVGNSGDTPIGTYEDIYYVLVDLDSNYIIPVARSDEHQLGTDMLYDLYDKYKLPQGRYVPVAVRGTNYLQNRNDENRVMTLEAIKKWVSYGGNKVMIEDQTPDGAVKIDSDTFMELGKVEPYKGSLSASGRYIVDTFNYLSDTLNKIYKAYRKEPLIKKFNSTALTLLQWLRDTFVFELTPLMKNIDKGIAQIMASGDDDYSAAETVIFSHGGIKNAMHNKLRAIEKDPKDYDKNNYQMVFGDLTVAKKEFDMVDPGINVAGSTKHHVNIVHVLNYIEFISDNVTVSDFVAENVPEGSIVLGLYKIPISMLHPTENLDTKDLDNVRGMVAALERGEDMKPVSVLFNSETGYFDIFDGHHRYMAYSELEKDMPCIVVAEPESFDNGPVAEGVDMKDQMSKGKEVEKEHDSTYIWIQDYYKEHGVFPPIDKVRESISKDHILEIENYYDLIEDIEKKAGVKALKGFKSLAFMQPDLIIENEVSWEVFLAYCKKDERALELFVWLTDTFCGKHIPEELVFQYIQCSVENLALNPKSSDDSSDFRFHVYTENNSYCIVVKFKPDGSDRGSYLGCTYTCRKRDAGEDWNRGGDLADGCFSKETFNDIVSDIIATELVQLYTTKEYPMIRDHFENKAITKNVMASVEPGPVDEVNNREWYHGNRGLDFPLDYPPVYFSSSPEVAAKFADAGKYTMVVDGEVFLNIDSEQAQWIVDVFEPTYEPDDIVRWGDLLNSGYDEKDVAELRKLLSDMWGLVDVKTFALVLKSVYQSNFYVAKINVKSVKVVDYQGRVWGTTDTFIDVDAENAFEEGYDCFLGKNVQEGGIAFEGDFPVADTLVVFKKEAVSSFIASEPK